MSKIDKAIRVYVTQLEARSKVSTQVTAELEQLANEVESGMLSEHSIVSAIRDMAAKLAVGSTYGKPIGGEAEREQAIKNAARRGMNFHVFAMTNGREQHHSSWASHGVACQVARTHAGDVYNSDGDLIAATLPGPEDKQP